MSRLQKLCRVPSVRVWCTSRFVLRGLDEVRTLRRAMSTTKRPIDFLSGWPNPTLLPPQHLETAAHTVLNDPKVAEASLKYAPDEGYHPLREEIGKWLTR